MAGISCLPSPGQAAESLRLEEAVARALAANPALVAESAQLQAAQARAQREALAPAFVLGSELENVAGTGALSGMDSAEATLRIGRVIELGGKRAARQALGRAEVSQQENLGQIARLDITSRTAARFIEVVARQQKLAYAREQVEQAGRTREAVEAWVRAARNPESDLRAAEIAVVEAELAQEDAEHELESARVTLAASWGALVPDFAAAAGALQDLPPVESFEVLAARLPLSAQQRAAQLEAGTVAARRQVAQAAARPDLNLSLGVRRLEAFNDQGLVMSLSMPLGSRARARHGIAEADARLAALEARREAERVERHQAFFALYQQLLHSRTEFEAYRDRMLPKAEEALQFTRRGFEAGRFSFAALAQAQKTLFDLRERALAAATHYHQQLVEVEHLTAVTREAQP